MHLILHSEVLISINEKRKPTGIKKLNPCKAGVLLSLRSSCGLVAVLILMLELECKFQVSSLLRLPKNANENKLNPLVEQNNDYTSQEPQCVDGSLVIRPCSFHLGDATSY